jgi:hypothetical protein
VKGRATGGTCSCGAARRNPNLPGASAQYRCRGEKRGERRWPALSCGHPRHRVTILEVNYEIRGGPDSLRWFWSLTVNRPMTRSGRVATLEEAEAQFQMSWHAWKAWAELEEGA